MTKICLFHEVLVNLCHIAFMQESYIDQHP